VLVTWTHLPEGAVLAGAWAPELLSGPQASPGDYRLGEYRRPVRRYGVTHLVSPENGSMRVVLEAVSRDDGPAQRQVRGQVGDIVLYVYELAGTADGRYYRSLSVATAVR